MNFAKKRPVARPKLMRLPSRSVTSRPERFLAERGLPGGTFQQRVIKPIQNRAKQREPDHGMDNGNNYCIRRAPRHHPAHAHGRGNSKRKKQDHATKKRRDASQL